MAASVLAQTGRVVGYGSSCSTQEFEVIGARGRSSGGENVTREPMITVLAAGSFVAVYRAPGRRDMGGKQ